MVARVEDPLDVRFSHHMLLSELEVAGALVYGLLCPKRRTISITPAQDILRIDGGEYPRDRKLPYLIFDGGKP